MDHSFADLAAPAHESQPRPRRRLVLVVGGLAAGRALVGHLTLPLLVVVRGTAFLPLLLVRPNEATVAVGAIQARAGLIPWSALVVAVVVGAVASDLLSYAIGRILGEPALARLTRSRHGRASRAVARTRAVVERRGAVAVLLGRPTVVTHGVVPVMAGVCGMPLGRFTVASAGGAAVWASAWVAGGAAVAALATRNLGLVLVVTAVAAVVAAAVVLCARRDRCLRFA